MSRSSPDPFADTVAFRRPGDEVMRLTRMGSSHPTRLSFLRALLRRLATEGWKIDRPIWDVDGSGAGHAVYRARDGSRIYSLVAFAHDLPDAMRSDRVIATAWDATFTLFDGDPTPADIKRLQANVPLQEAGRISHRELTLARANRSVHLFRHVVDALSQGHQPDPREIAATGYLMRTTAVYGSGRFGGADRTDIADRPELAAPFQVEMLTVWLIRAFTVDIAEHMARTKGGARAVRLEPAIRRDLGVGNSTGLGMAPFIVRHLVLLNNWIMAREEALARVRARATTTDTVIADFRLALDAAIRNAAAWTSDHPVQIPKLHDLRHDLDLISAQIVTVDPARPRPWDAPWQWGGDALSVEGQEVLVALLLEPLGDLADDLSDNLIAEDMLPIDLLRCKLAFFGASRFDPRSDRWVRINLFQGAPFPDELGSDDLQ